MRLIYSERRQLSRWPLMLPAKVKGPQIAQHPAALALKNKYPGARLSCSAPYRQAQTAVAPALQCQAWNVPLVPLWPWGVPIDAVVFGSHLAGFYCCPLDPRRNPVHKVFPRMLKPDLHPRPMRDGRPALRIYGTQRPLNAPGENFW